MIIRRIGPLSAAKITGTVYALMGFIGGAVISGISVVTGAFGNFGGNDAGMMGMLFGAAAVVLLPIFYGCVGFVTTLIGAAIYNLVAGWVGGMEIEAQ